VIRRRSLLFLHVSFCGVKFGEGWYAEVLFRVSFKHFYVSTFYFILWAAVSAAYSALLSGSYFERINDDDFNRLA